MPYKHPSTKNNCHTFADFQKDLLPLCHAKVGGEASKAAFPPMCLATETINSLVWTTV